MANKSLKDLREGVLGVSKPLRELVETLPNEVRPRPFAGFGAKSVGADQSEMRGWDYDWDDRGSDPPPWADWSNKSE